jgi:hypothetical protein
VDCPIGFSQSDKGQASCVKCSPGEFNDVAGAVKCKFCLNATYVGGKGRDRSCIDCPSGWSSEDGSAKCVACGAGTFGIGCKKCPLGFARQRDNNDATQCQQCILGETTSIEGAAECDSCDAGKFGKTQGICSKCPSGFYQNNKGETACIDCALGKRYVDGKTSCGGCGLGSYGHQKGQCSSCPAGRYQDGKGETSCKECDADTYLNEQGKSSKADCVACSKDKSTGTSTANTNEVSCRCKKRQSEKEPGFYTDAMSNCQPCPSGANCATRDGMLLSELFALPGYYRPDISSDTFISCHQGYTPPTPVSPSEERCCPLDSSTNISICNTTNIDMQCLEG